MMKLYSGRLVYVCLGAMLMAFSACSGADEDDELEFTVINGQVLDSWEHKPVPGATIEVRSVKKAMCNTNCQDQLAAAAVFEFERPADSQGNFSIGFKADPNRYYYLLPRSANYFYTGFINPAILKQGQENNGYKLILHPYSWIKFVITNEGPKDTALIMFNGPFVEGPFELRNFTGNTSLVKRTKENSKFPLSVTLHKSDGTVNKQSRELTVRPGDTVNFEVKY